MSENFYNWYHIITNYTDKKTLKKANANLECSIGRFLKNLHGQCLMEYPRVPKSDHKKNQDIIYRYRSNFIFSYGK